MALTMTKRTVLQDDRGGIEATEAGECSWCGHMTNRVDINFESYLHYDCVPIQVDAYLNALGQIPNEENE